MHKTLICLVEISNTVTSQNALKKEKEQLVDTRYIYIKCLDCSLPVAMHIWTFVLIACRAFRNTPGNIPPQAWFKRYLSHTTLPERSHTPSLCSSPTGRTQWSDILSASPFYETIIINDLLPEYLDQVCWYAFWSRYSSYFNYYMPKFKHLVEKFKKWIICYDGCIEFPPRPPDHSTFLLYVGVQ